MKRFLFIVPLCIIALALLACGVSSNANTGTTATRSNTPPVQQQHFKVGDTVTVGNWKVVVNSITTNPGDNFNKPQKGAFVVVNVSLTNVSNQEQSVSSILNFKFKGADGTAYTESYLSTASPAPNGKVAAGDVTKGDLVYDVPADQKTFTLSFAPDIISSGQTIWDLTLP